MEQAAAVGAIARTLLGGLHMLLGQRRSRFGRKSRRTAVAAEQVLALQKQPQRCGVVAAGHGLAALPDPTVAHRLPGLLQQTGKLRMEWVQLLRLLQNAKRLFAVPLSQKRSPARNQSRRFAPVLYGLQDVLRLPSTVAVVQRGLGLGHRRLQVVRIQAVFGPRQVILIRPLLNLLEVTLPAGHRPIEAQRLGHSPDRSVPLSLLGQRQRFAAHPFGVGRSAGDALAHRAIQRLGRTIADAAFDELLRARQIGLSEAEFGLAIVELARLLFGLFELLAIAIGGFVVVALLGQGDRLFQLLDRLLVLALLREPGALLVCLLMRASRRDQKDRQRHHRGQQPAHPLASILTCCPHH